MTINAVLFSTLTLLLMNLLSIRGVFAEQETVGAEDTIITLSSSSKLDIRSKYTHEVLAKALELSVEKFGRYTHIRRPISMPHDVSFYEVSRGRIINLTMSAATPDKDHLAIPIRIPLRRGILNYRLLVINEDKLELFQRITNLEQLKPYTVGIHANAVTSEVMEVLGFSVIEGASYDGMFRQLSQNRFDYLPRGIHEAYDELDIRKGTIDNLIIAPNIALYMPMPYYVYVSPAFPKIAKRIKYGLEKMVEKQMIKSIFDSYYAEHVKRANLSERTIINVGNPFLSLETPLDRKELWIDEFAIKHENVQP